MNVIYVIGIIVVIGMFIENEIKDRKKDKFFKEMGFEVLR